MESVIFHTKLQFLSNFVAISLSRDFYHNCLTVDPFSHSHPIFELHYVVKGGITVEMKNETVHCEEDSFLLLSPNITHRVLPDKDDTETISLLLDMNGIISYSKEIYVIHDSFSGRKRLFNIRDELLNKSPIYTEKIRGELTILLADILRELGEPDKPVKEVSDNRAEQIQAYLMRHRFDPCCSLESLAENLHLSVRQTQRLCLQFYGATFRSLLTSMRMEIAVYRLATTNVSISDLAEQIGYSSAAYFSAAYKRYFGKSPSQERV